MIAVMVLSYIIQATLNSRFEKYSRIRGPHGLTGADVARLMLRQNGITDVSVECIPGRLRSALVPVVTFANNTVQWVLLLGVLLINVFPSLLWIGIGLFAMTTIFSLVTLPVEINASRRAVAWLEGSGVVDAETKPYAADALKWAAYTYVIAALGSLATLFYYISIANSRRD